MTELYRGNKVSTTVKLSSNQLQSPAPQEQSRKPPTPALRSQQPTHPGKWGHRRRALYDLVTITSSKLLDKPGKAMRRDLRAMKLSCVSPWRRPPLHSHHNPSSQSQPQYTKFRKIRKDTACTPTVMCTASTAGQMCMRTYAELLTPSFQLCQTQS